jgi:hypothetical protein
VTGESTAVLAVRRQERGSPLPDTEHGQIKTMPIEGNQLRSQLADFFDAVPDQLSLRSLPV